MPHVRWAALALATLASIGASHCGCASRGDFALEDDGRASPSPLDRPMPPNERGAQLSAAIAAAQPGAVIELETGTYTGTFSIDGKPDLTIRAAPGAHAVLTLRDPRFAAPGAPWSPVQGRAGVYRATEVLGGSIYREGGERVIHAKDRAHFDVLVADEIPAAHRGTGETLIYLGGEDPRTLPLWISKTDQAVISCQKSPRLRLEGLDIRFGGAQGIDFRAGCDGSVVDGVSIYGGRDAVRVKDGSSSHVTVRRSWLVNHIDPRWYYRDVKGNAVMEGSGILLPGPHQVVEENILQGWFNGICMVCTSLCDTVDPVIRRNLLDGILDDAVELDGVVVRGEVAENLIRDAFVVFSFAPRLVRTPGEDTWIHHNAVAATRTPLFDRATPGVPARGQGTKFNSHPVVDGVPTAARDLLFESNTFVCDAECARGAPSGQRAYPSRIRWIGNILVSRLGPIVRHTGAPADGNLFERNFYAGGFFAENWAVPFNGRRVRYRTLAAARGSAPGVAAAWEAQGGQGDPQFVLPGEPSSLRAGSPAEGRGAFERAPLRVDATVRLPTGWILLRGAGFESDGRGLGVVQPIVVSSSTAFAREVVEPQAPR
jgi:hypothetical protein